MGAHADEAGGAVGVRVLWWRTVDIATVADAAIFRSARMTGQTGGLGDASGVVAAVTALAVGHIPTGGANRLTVEVVRGRFQPTGRMSLDRDFDLAIDM